jgi:hypothetical protein
MGAEQIELKQATTMQSDGVSFFLDNERQGIIEINVRLQTEMTVNLSSVISEST